MAASKSNTKSKPKRKPAAKKKRMTKAEREYRAKYNMIQKINKRIRDTVNRIGVYNETVQTWETALTLAGRNSIQAYDENGNMYHLISRSREDIENMSMEDLRQLEAQTPTWQTTRNQIIREMNAERAPGDQYTRANPPTLEEIRAKASYTQQLHRMFEENADLFYMLLDSTKVDDIRELTTMQIWEEVQKINAQLASGQPFNWSAPPEVIGDEYKARLAESKKRKEDALRRSNFTE